MKLSLCELCDPLVPNEMYNECIQHSRDHLACIRIVEWLLTINVKPSIKLSALWTEKNL
ncbi:uncharacterized protein LACBIDRAFT_312529 [Laccaria bicolor S238N-H82]|uniref:Predicted protein n=1 Tax=Laccaria bicolor (strain S238N-H82 / ATCC MYA-4686) TaxID=486041 RepID=B0DWC4_LACBS|nr:uncharacterized protein LACBIDRAFT_312529 [Laccaria bicolor S238N-H82]EDR01200.1 predicted protein [Laccaria bicolor S238N-H82]|eukprot:XP_001888242.1 predicted protein [Laccaria bicolor S238N-H82]